MGNDPFDRWYASQLTINLEENFKAGDWDFFTINYDIQSPDEVQVVPMIRENVDGWVELQTKRPSQLPGVDLLIATHKELGKRDMDYCALPFRPKLFEYIFDRLQLPKQYFHLRATGGAQIGATAYSTKRDDSGKVTSISFVIRPAHGSLTIYGGSYRFAFTWNAFTGRTTGFIENFTQDDLKNLVGFVKDCGKSLIHPLTLPEIILHEIMIHLNERIRIPIENEFYQQESRTGLSRVLPTQDHFAVWNWSFRDFQESTRKINRFITALAYLRRRFSFASHLTRRFLAVMDDLKTYKFDNSEIADAIRKEEYQRRERLLNCLGLLENNEHQTECVQKRAENLVTVLYTVLSQIDSRNQGQIAKINLKIAQAVRSDSIPIRTIAYVTLVLLPGAFISGIFGTNFFTFDTRTRKLVVAKSFWQYWAITLPVTICIVLIWNIWVWWEKRDSVETTYQGQHSKLFLELGHEQGGCMGAPHGRQPSGALQLEEIDAGTTASKVWDRMRTF